MGETQINVPCSGCGALLQGDYEDGPGYLPQDALQREQALCRRCYRIRHYGEFPAVKMSAAEQEEQILAIGRAPGLILYVVDGFDLQGSMIEELSRYVKGFPLQVVVNKADLFPKEVKLFRLANWIQAIVEQAGIHPLGVSFVSAKSGAGFDELMASLVASGEQRVYVLGRANVGKSTLLNRFVKQFVSMEPFTTSRVPGTTLGLAEVQIDLRDGRTVTLVDVPGLIQGNRLTDSLCPDCLQTVLPSSRLRPRVFQLNPGQSLWFGGIARFDFKLGKPQSIVCYVSNDVVIHRTKLERAEEFGNNHMDDILKIPCPACRVNLGALTASQILAGRFAIGKQAGQKTVAFRQPADVVLPGLGWIAFSGQDLEGAMWSVPMMSILSRPRLLGELTQFVPQKRKFER